MENGTMSNHCFTIIALTLLCGLLSNSSAQAQSKDNKEGTSTVSGRVTIKGEPAPGIPVILQPQQMLESGNTGPIPSVKTDVNGIFRITGVPAGRYFLNPFAPGFIGSGDLYFNAMPRGSVFQIGDGEDIEKIEIILIRGSVITGRVIGSNGRPLVEERVEVMKLDIAGKRQEFHLGVMQMMQTTDDRGIYRIFGLPEGRYLVSVGYPEGVVRMGSGAQYQKTYYPNVTDQSQAKIVEVGEGEEASGIDIKVGEARKTYNVFGRVVNAENGQPVAGASISIGALAPDGKLVNSWVGLGIYSNAMGEFQFSNMAPGKYVAFTGVHFGSSRVVSYYSEPALFEVSEGNVHGIEIKVRNGSTISGLIVLEGTNDMAVLAKIPDMILHISSIPAQTGQISMPYGNEINIKSDGSFSFQGLPPGKVYLNLQAIPGLEGLSLIRIERDGVLQPREGIEIGTGEHISNLRLIAVNGTLSLRGEIKIVGGTLPKNITFYIHAYIKDNPDISRGSQVDARNNFVIEHMMPGEYVLLLGISNAAPGQQNIDPQLSRKISEIRHKVVVSSNNQQPVILTVDLSQGGSKQ
jgi:hypothetical protein